MFYQEVHNGWLNCSWNSCGMGCDTVTILGVERVVCWGFGSVAVMLCWCVWFWSIVVVCVVHK